MGKRRFVAMPRFPFDPNGFGFLFGGPVEGSQRFSKSPLFWGLVVGSPKGLWVVQRTRFSPLVYTVLLVLWLHRCFQDRHNPRFIDVHSLLK